MLRRKLMPALTAFALSLLVSVPPVALAMLWLFMNG